MDGTSPQPPSLAAASDASLIRQIADRQPESLGELYNRYSAILLGLARRILGSSADAEEVLQEVFVHVWNQGGRYDAGRSSVSTWLVLITRSRAIDRLRSRKVVERTHDAAHREEALEHTSPEGAKNVFMQERRKRVRQEMDRLPAEQREVLELAFYKGLTQTQIASLAGIPLGTVKTRTLLAMKKLRNALREEIRELL